MGGFPNLTGVLAHHFELWIDDNFVGPQFYDRLSSERNFDVHKKLVAQRAAHRVSLCGESTSAFDIECDPFTGHSLLALIIMSENFEMLERLVGKGVNMNMRYVFHRKRLKIEVPGMTVLHYASRQTNADVMKLLADSSSICPSCARTSAGNTPIQVAFCRLPVLKVLIHDCLVDIATSENTGFTPLHRAADLATKRRIGGAYGITSRPFDSAMLLLEGDYQRAIRGAPWFNTKSTKTLLTARDSLLGMTALELAIAEGCPEEESDFIELLRGWESSPLAIPPPGYKSSTEIAMFNPQLTPFQIFLAHGVRDLLNDTAIHSVTYQVLGYLTPLDVLSKWNEWRADIATPNPVQCYCCSVRHK